jgi:hypothetical protein
MYVDPDAALSLSKPISQATRICVDDIDSGGERDVSVARNLLLANAGGDGSGEYIQYCTVVYRRSQ